jgi:hypothetical protein
LLVGWLVGWLVGSICRNAYSEYILEGRVHINVRRFNLQNYWVDLIEIFSIGVLHHKLSIEFNFGSKHEALIEYYEFTQKRFIVERNCLHDLKYGHVELYIKERTSIQRV